MAVNDSDNLNPVTVSNNADWAETHEINLPAGGGGYVASGFSARMQVRLTPESQFAVVDIATGTVNMQITTVGGDVYLKFSVPAATMAGIQPDDYVRDILIFYQASAIYAGRGDVKVLQGITRS